MPQGRLKVLSVPCHSQARGHDVKLFKRTVCVCGKACEQYFVHEFKQYSAGPAVEAQLKFCMYCCAECVSARTVVLNS